MCSMPLLESKKLPKDRRNSTTQQRDQKIKNEVLHLTGNEHAPHKEIRKKLLIINDFCHPKLVFPLTV